MILTWGRPVSSSSSTASPASFGAAPPIVQIAAGTRSSSAPGAKCNHSSQSPPDALQYALPRARG
ncbi:MAG: hypothetical protein U0359_23045 [Byssovorax sp.]